MSFILVVVLTAVVVDVLINSCYSVLKAGYYLPDAEIIYDNYHVINPAVDDVSQFGPRIYSACQYFDTFRLTRAETSGMIDERFTNTLEFSSLTTFKSIKPIFESARAVFELLYSGIR